nr:hypothetical protein [Tanacetum cinerariifolium]
MSKLSGRKSVPGMNSRKRGKWKKRLLGLHVSYMDDDLPDIFMIEGNLFDFETPMCEAFNNFNHLLKIDNDLFNFEIQGTRTYKEYKLNNPVTRDLEETWLDNWVPYQLCDHICEPYRFKNEIAKWPTCSSDVDGFCNGGSYLGWLGSEA